MRILRRILLLILFLTGTGSLVAGTVPVDQAIIEHMFSLYDLNSAQYEIEILSNPLVTEQVSPGEFSLKPLTQKSPAGLFSIMATITRDGQEVESRQVRLRIKLLGEVLVVQDRVNRSMPMSQVQTELARRDVTELKERPIVDRAELVGYQSRRNLQRGEILTAGDIELIPDVVNGNDVEIVYVDGFCRVTAPGRVLEKGSIGDHIRVKNTATNKVIVARVVDGSAVAVDP
ncbi:MAG: flagellar basal body P-ring formation chaperone FlgA [bacterium]